MRERARQLRTRGGLKDFAVLPFVRAPDLRFVDFRLIREFMKMPTKQTIQEILHIADVQALEDTIHGASSEESVGIALARNSMLAAARALEVVPLLPKAIRCLGETKCCCGPAGCVSRQLQALLDTVET